MKETHIGWILLITVIAMTICLMFSENVYAENVDLDIIIQIESSWRNIAGPTDDHGLCQVTSLTLKEYNRLHKNKYTKDDLYNPQINMKVATWYLNERLPQLLKHYNVPVTLENVVQAYNLGARGVASGKTNKGYVKKYLVAKGTK